MSSVTRRNGGTPGQENRGVIWKTMPEQTTSCWDTYHKPQRKKERKKIIIIFHCKTIIYVAFKELPLSHTGFLLHRFVPGDYGQKKSQIWALYSFHYGQPIWTNLRRYIEMNKSRTKLLETYRIKLGHRAFVRSNALINIPKCFPYLY